jgi:hypothetical protein
MSLNAEFHSKSNLGYNSESSESWNLTQFRMVEVMVPQVWLRCQIFVHAKSCSSRSLVELTVVTEEGQVDPDQVASPSARTRALLRNVLDSLPSWSSTPVPGNNPAAPAATATSPAVNLPGLPWVA